MEFERFIKLIGNDNFNILKNKNILIIGIGGVGGYALEGLVRSGILNITIVDYDKIDITNLNRQIIALKNNIGKYKVDVAQERILNINENVNIKRIKEKLNKLNINNIFEKNYDYVIDACDDVTAKKLIIKKCLNEKIKFISCMGTGNKFNPSLLSVTELKKTKYDKLAKKMRKWAIDENIKDKIIVVSSVEQCTKFDGVIGSTSYVPAVAGMLCASYVINDIIKISNV